MRLMRSWLSTLILMERQCHGRGSVKEIILTELKKCLLSIWDSTWSSKSAVAPWWSKNSLPIMKILNWRKWTTKTQEEQLPLVTQMAFRNNKKWHWPEVLRMLGLQEQEEAWLPCLRPSKKLWVGLEDQEVEEESDIVYHELHIELNLNRVINKLVL